MKNEFKKRDAKGNQLPEQIGKGLNAEHWAKVKAAREMLTETIAFRVPEKTKLQLDKFAKGVQLKPSDILKVLLKRLLDDDIDATKLDFIVKEMTLKDEKIAQLEYCLEQLKSQLSDTFSKDSVIMTIINENLKK